MKGHASEVAVDFSRALVAGRFEVAHGYLCSSLQDSLSVAQLEEEFRSLGRSYDGGTLTEIEEMERMDDWPDKQPDDICWCYIAISGKSARHEGWISEAVQVVLMRENAGIYVRTIEWGRP
jgi:hypothetical protein